jgi:hypothetical protein
VKIKLSVDYVIERNYLKFTENKTYKKIKVPYLNIEFVNTSDTVISIKYPYLKDFLITEPMCIQSGRWSPYLLKEDLYLMDTYVKKFRGERNDTLEIVLNDSIINNIFCSRLLDVSKVLLYQKKLMPHRKLMYFKIPWKINKSIKQHKKLRYEKVEIEPFVILEPKTSVKYRQSLKAFAIACPYNVVKLKFKQSSNAALNMQSNTVVVNLESIDFN